MAWYIKTINESHRKEIDNINALHKNEADKFTEAINKLEQYTEGETKQIQQIALSISYYQMLYTNLPDDYPSKKEWMRKGFPGLMELPGIKRICGELLPEMPQMADTLQGYMEQCDALIQYLK